MVMNVLAQRFPSLILNIKFFLVGKFTKKYRISVIAKKIPFLVVVTDYRYRALVIANSSKQIYRTPDYNLKYREV